MEKSSAAGPSGVHSPKVERERPFAVVPAAAAGLRLLIVNPVYFLWPLALLFVVLVLGPTVSAGLERAAPPRVERSAPVDDIASITDNIDEAAVEGVDDGEAFAAGGPDDTDAASTPRRGFGSCRATKPGANDADQLSRGSGGGPRSPVAAILGLIFGVAAPIAFIAVQASVFRLVTGRAVGSGPALRLGADELRLAAVNVLVPMLCVAVAAPIAIVGMGVQWLPGPCGAVNGVATLLFVVAGLAALAVLVRLALVGPAVIAERRLTAWRAGVEASRDVVDLITMSSLAGVASSALLAAPLMIAMSLISGGGSGGQRGGPGGGHGGGPGGGSGGGPRGAGGPPDVDPTAAIPMQSATTLVIFLFLVTLSAAAAYAYVRVTRGADPDALAITPEEPA